MPSAELVHSTRYWNIETVPLVPGARLHFRLSPIQPVDDMLKLPNAALDDYWTALVWLIDGYELTYYCTVSRNGDQRYTGGPDPYACVYVVVGDPESDVIVKHPVSSGAAHG